MSILAKRPKHSAKYKAHLRSPEWARIRKAALERAGYRCAFCGLTQQQLRARGRHLEAHHSTYANLGHERPEDLTILCAGGRGGGCHTAADRQRREGAGQRPASRKRKGRRRSRGHRRGPLRELCRVAVIFVGTAGCLKVAAIVLPLLSAPH